jgi:hypothetical protein
VLVTRALRSDTLDALRIPYFSDGRRAEDPTPEQVAAA